jgi:cyclopropane-fatty-acyl-phospholipid synthase
MSLSVSHKDVFKTPDNGDGQRVSGPQREISTPNDIGSETRLSAPIASTSSKPPSSVFERWLCRRLLKTLGYPPVNIVLWDNTEIGTSEQSPVAQLIIHNRLAMRRLILDPEFQFGEAYTDQELEIDGDLRAFLEAIYRARLKSGSNYGRLKKIISRILHVKRPNSIATSRDNIHQHYDVGNEFYQLWLDADMIYSCAYFANDDLTLADAQQAKLAYVCRKLWLQPGETVLDIGGGWGGLAMYMARNYGVTVKAYNISRQQIDLARHRARIEGLDGRVEFIEDDYRNITGRFDALVSLGMLEHVGKGHYRDFGRVCDRCLDTHGRALIQTIAKSRPGETNPWIQRRIFPGGYVPLLSEMTDIVEPFGFAVLDLENLRLHYAKTLELWLDRFEASADSVKKMFDDRFVRMWRLYLSGSWAAFASGALQLFQFLFARQNCNAIPKTRSHLERHPERSEGSRKKIL